MDDPQGVRLIDDTPGSTGTLASSVYALLRKDILNCRLEPGRKLRLQHLATEYGVGNSTLREALNRLASSGLVTLEENKGFRVSTASVAELEELIRTRCMLEETALRASIADGEEEWEERVVLAFHRLSRLEQVSGNGVEHRTPDWETAHQEYHIALLSACGSNTLLDYCRQLQEQTLRYRSLIEVVQYRDMYECSEHLKIQEAVLARDDKRAIELIHAHYNVTLNIILSGGTLD